MVVERLNVMSGSLLVLGCIECLSGIPSLYYVFSYSVCLFSFFFVE